MRTISQSELAALTDLGLADDAIAKYLQISANGVAELRNRYRLGDSGDAAPDVAAVPDPISKKAPAAGIAQMREQARRLMAESQASADHELKAKSAKHAFELAQLAECEERRFLDMAATLGRAAGARTKRNDADAAAILLDKAKRWRMRAAEYWAVSEALRTPVARETYAHLARSYERLAEQFEARAQLSFGRQPSKEQAG